MAILPCTQRQRENGFTLLEVLIAAALFGFVILCLGTLFSYTLRTLTYARQATAAASLARNTIEEAKNTAYAKLLSALRCYDKELANLGPVSDPYTECRQGTDQLPFPSTVYQCRTTVTPSTGNAGLAEVRVIVTWLDVSMKNRRVDLVSAVSQY